MFPAGYCVSAQKQTMAHQVATHESELRTLLVLRYSTRTLHDQLQLNSVLQNVFPLNNSGKKPLPQRLGSHQSDYLEELLTGPQLEG
jgi:hypothetical protein